MRQLDQQLSLAQLLRCARGSRALTAAPAAPARARSSSRPTAPGGQTTGSSVAVHGDRHRLSERVRGDPRNALEIVLAGGLAAETIVSGADRGARAAPRSVTCVTASRRRWRRLVRPEANPGTPPGYPSDGTSDGYTS